MTEKYENQFECLHMFECSNLRVQSKRRNGLRTHIAAWRQQQKLMHSNRSITSNKVNIDDETQRNEYCRESSISKLCFVISNSLSLFSFRCIFLHMFRKHRRQLCDDDLANTRLLAKFSIIRILCREWYTKAMLKQSHMNVFYPVIFHSLQRAELCRWTESQSVKFRSIHVIYYILELCHS